MFAPWGLGRETPELVTVNSLPRADGLDSNRSRLSSFRNDVIFGFFVKDGCAVSDSRSDVRIWRVRCALWKPKESPKVDPKKADSGKKDAPTV